MNDYGSSNPHSGEPLYPYPFAFLINESDNGDDVSFHPLVRASATAEAMARHTEEVPWLDACHSHPTLNVNVCSLKPEPKSRCRCSACAVTTSVSNPTRCSLIGTPQSSTTHHRSTLTRCGPNPDQVQVLVTNKWTSVLSQQLDVPDDDAVAKVPIHDIHLVAHAFFPPHSSLTCELRAISGAHGSPVDPNLASQGAADRSSATQRGLSCCADFGLC